MTTHRARPPADIDPLLLTKREAAGLLRISVRTLETRLIAAGRLVLVRPVPGRALIRKPDVLALIDRLAEGAAQPLPKTSSKES